jgi:hypothetical protein
MLAGEHTLRHAVDRAVCAAVESARSSSRCAAAPRAEEVGELGSLVIAFRCASIRARTHAAVIAKQVGADVDAAERKHHLPPLELRAEARHGVKSVRPRWTRVPLGPAQLLRERPELAVAAGHRAAAEPAREIPARIELRDAPSAASFSLPDDSLSTSANAVLK